MTTNDKTHKALEQANAMIAADPYPRYEYVAQNHEVEARRAEKYARTLLCESLARTHSFAGVAKPADPRFELVERAHLIAVAKDCAATDPERHNYTRGARGDDWEPHEWVLKAMAAVAASTPAQPPAEGADDAACEALAQKGWQCVECPVCGSSTARGYPRPPVAAVPEVPPEGVVEAMKRVWWESGCSHIMSTTTAYKLYAIVRATTTSPAPAAQARKDRNAAMQAIQDALDAKKAPAAQGEFTPFIRPDGTTFIDDLLAAEAQATAAQKIVGWLRNEHEGFAAIDPLFIGGSHNPTPGINGATYTPLATPERAEVRPPVPLSADEIADLWAAFPFEVTDLPLAAMFVRDVEVRLGITPHSEADSAQGGATGVSNAD